MSLTPQQFTEQAQSIATAASWAKRDQLPLSIYHHKDRGLCGHMRGMRHHVPRDARWLLDFASNATPAEAVARITQAAREKGVVL